MSMQMLKQDVLIEINRNWRNKTIASKLDDRCANENDLWKCNSTEQLISCKFSAKLFIVKYYTEHKFDINDNCVDSVFETRTRGSRIEGADESTELRRHPISVISKKSPNVFKSCPKMISIEKLEILTH